MYKFDHSKSKNFYTMKINTTKIRKDSLWEEKYITQNNTLAFIMQGTHWRTDERTLA